MKEPPSGAAEPPRFTAVVMAGRRSGPDPLATAASVSHKCLVEVGGKPMLERVLETLDASAWIAGSVLCVEPSFDEPAFVTARIERGTLRRLEAAGSPAASATRACEQLTGRMPLLIVTADHPLLDGAMLDYFCARALQAGDVAAGVALADVVLGRYPNATRTLLRFSDGPYCGCNLFSLNTPAAARATRFWMRVEAERKKPWRLVRMLGAMSLMAYLGGRLPLPRALQIISGKLGIQAGAVALPYAEAAIDVDKPGDLALVDTILQRGN